MQTPAFHKFHQWHANHTSPPIEFHSSISYPMLHRTHKSPSVTRSNKSSKIDKQRWISSNLHHLHLDYIGSPSDHWKTIKRIRSKYQLRSYEPNQLINLTGLHLLNLKNHTFSNSKPLPDPIEDPLAPPQADLDIAFTMFELYRAFRRTKTGRAPGPDSHPLEASRTPPTSSQAIPPPSL